MEKPSRTLLSQFELGPGPYTLKDYGAFEVFAEFWLGPRQPSFGAQVEELDSVELPEALARFLAFGGSWPHPWCEANAVLRELPSGPFNIFSSLNTIRRPLEEDVEGDLVVFGQVYQTSTPLAVELASGAVYAATGEESVREPFWDLWDTSIADFLLRNLLAGLLELHLWTAGPAARESALSFAQTCLSEAISLGDARVRMTDESNPVHLAYLPAIKDVLLIGGMSSAYETNFGGVAFGFRSIHSRKQFREFLEARS